MQHQLSEGDLLDARGRLAEAGWATQEKKRRASEENRGGESET